MHGAGGGAAADEDQGEEDDEGDNNDEEEEEEEDDEIEMGEEKDAQAVREVGHTPWLGLSRFGDHCFGGFVLVSIWRGFGIG